MRNIPAALLTHLGQDTQTLTWCLTLTRQDGVQIGFTEHDQPVTVDGVVCEPQRGSSVSALSSTSGQAVDNAEMTAFLESDLMTESDLMSGVYDGAELKIFLVNWASPGDFLLVSRGPIGEVSSGDTGFRAEFRSLTQYLQQTIGRKVGIECDAAELGDERCKAGLLSFTHGGSVTAITDDRQVFTVDMSGAGAGDPTYFEYGRLTWTNGDGRNTQKDYRVKSWNGAGLVTVVGKTVDTVQVGDTLQMIAGCDRRYATCAGRFSNHENFQGFPHVPGRDSVVEQARGR